MPETGFTDVRRFASLDSTNRYLLDEARAGAPEGVVAVADHQTAGRGRLGRTWEAPSGANLLLSVLLRPDLGPNQRHLAATAVALAALDVIVGSEAIGSDVSGGGGHGGGGPGGAGGGGQAGGPGGGGQAGGPGCPGGRSVPGVGPRLPPTVGIKWPNDLVTPDGRKLAGVLAEADVTSTATGVPAPVVVGIGVNVNWPASDAELPPELRGIACSLRQLVGAVVDREALLAALLAALVPRVAALATVAGRTCLAADLRAACTTLGRPVRVDLTDESFFGTATTVTDDGHLVVDVDGIPRAVVVGDVVHVRPAG